MDSEKRGEGSEHQLYHPARSFKKGKEGFLPKLGGLWSIR